MLLPHILKVQTTIALQTQTEILKITIALQPKIEILPHLMNYKYLALYYSFSQEQRP